MSASPEDRAGLASTRAAVYRFLRSALDKPSPEQHAWLRAPEFRRGLVLLCAQFGESCPAEELVPESYANFESRYIACFEVGLPEPPLVLQASHYSRHEPAPRIVHEHILFYKHFGLSTVGATHESADHLLNELAFLIHLDDLAQRGRSESESLAMARRDFLDRHPGRWLPQAAERAAERGLPPLYCLLLALLHAAISHDRQLLDHTDGSDQRGTT
jgi:DMSO reductase family type II enzyme chaperone